jgi:hypothetical protein
VPLLLITTPHWLGVGTLDLKLTTQEVLAPGCRLGYNIKGKCPSIMALHSLCRLFSGVMPCCEGFYLHKKSHDGHSHKYGGHYVFYVVRCAICALEIMFLCTREPTRGVVVLVVPSIKDHISIYFDCVIHHLASSKYISCSATLKFSMHVSFVHYHAFYLWSLWCFFWMFHGWLLDLSVVGLAY